MFRQASIFAFILFCLSGFSQPRSLSIKEVESLVQSNLPQLEAYRDLSLASREGISQAKNSLIPDATVGYQANYATYNNITGMNYPSLMMPISGPPSANNNANFVPGTSLALMLKWNPLTFGQRNAAVEKATAQFRLANATYSQTLFKQQYLALYTYLQAVYFYQLLLSAQQNIRRVETELGQSLVLAKQGLRPGIDTIQLQSGLAQAQINFYTVQKAYQLQLVELTRLSGIGTQASDIVLSDTSLANRIPVQPEPGDSGLKNPVLLYYQAKQELGRASLKELQTAWRPRLDLWTNVYGRGSGVEYNGDINKSAGWNLTRTNYGAGFQISFPILQFSQINIQKKQYQFLLNADEAMLSQSSLDLEKQLESAFINFSQNKKIAEQADLQKKSAEFAYSGLVLSYNSGLVDFTRLTQGQTDLYNAETATAGAYLQMWHGLLDIAVAVGDMGLFMHQLK